MNSNYIIIIFISIILTSCVTPTVEKEDKAKIDNDNSKSGIYQYNKAMREYEYGTLK